MTCVIGDQCLVIHADNKSVNVFGYNPKAESKCTNIFDAAVAYDKPSKRKVCYSLNPPDNSDEGPQSTPYLSHAMPLTCVVIGEVPNILAPIPSETTHAIQVRNPSDAAHLFVIPTTIAWKK